MPYKLCITKEEVEAELRKMGYEDLSEEIIESFRKDLLKLIKNDLRKLKKLRQAHDESSKPSSSSQFQTSSTSVPSSYFELEKEKIRDSRDVSSDYESGSPSISSKKCSERLPSTSSEYSSSKSSDGRSLGIPEGETSSESIQTKDKQKHRALTKRNEEELPCYPERPDPVNLYHYYKAHWDKFKAPGEDSRAALRWEVRSKLFYSS